MQDCLIDELYIIDKVTYYPYKQDECLIYAPRNNLTVTLGNLDVENALACQQFLTIDEHVEKLFDVLSHYKQSKDDIRESLYRLIEKDLLVTPLVFIKEFDESAASQQDKSMLSDAPWQKGWVLAICSADRPALIARLFSTITPHLDELLVKPLIVFVDDSRDNVSTQKNLENLKAFSENNQLEFEFWDRKNRVSFCQKIGQLLPEDKASIDYLLSPMQPSNGQITIGQARNFSLLRASGKPLLMIDDDCLLNPLQDLNYDNKVSLGYSGRKARVKSSYDELFISYEKYPLNPLLEHLNILGKPMESILSDNQKDIEDPIFWKFKSKEMLYEISNAKYIGLSINSIVGALNSRQMNWFYSLNKSDVKNAEKLLESLDEDIHQTLDQATWSGNQFDEIGRNMPFFGTTICGVAPLPLIPPMPPFGRNEDLALGALIRYLYKESQVYQFGWALPHLPDPVRQWQPFRDQQEPEYNSTSFLILLLLMLEKDCPSSDPEERLEYLQLYLSKITKEEIVTLLKDDLYLHHTNSIMRIKDCAEQARMGSKYRVGSERMIQHHLFEMNNMNKEVERIGKGVATLLESYSMSLNHWISIWKYCSDVKGIFNE